MSLQLSWSALGKHVFQVERFDCVQAGDIGHRRALVSALTILELDEMMARYASYEHLAEAIRHRFTDPKDSLRELFGRLIFNILLSAAEIKQIITHQIAAIKANWDSVCDKAKLNPGEREILWNGGFLKDFAFEGLPFSKTENLRARRIDAAAQSSPEVPGRRRRRSALQLLYP